MFPKVLLLSSLLAVSLTSALPSTLTPRTCSQAYLPQLWIISQHVPQTPNGPSTTPFRVANDIGKKDLVASFRSIPSGAYGCTLEFDYKPNHNAVVDAQVGDPTLINVYTVSDGGNFPFPITWENTVARTGGLVGSFKFPSGNELNGASVRVINSMQCSQIMTFRFSVADDMAKGGVSVDVNALSGLRVSYNC